MAAPAPEALRVSTFRTPICRNCSVMGSLIYRSAWLVLAWLFVSGQLCADSSDQEWRFYGHDPGGMRFSPLTQINRSNVQRLQRAWTYDASRNSNNQSARIEPFEATPLMVNGVLYFTTPAGSAIAIDAETGKEIWVFDPFSDESGTRRHMPSRGVAYWKESTSGEHNFNARIFYATVDGRLLALDAQNGKPSPSFGNSGAVDLRQGVADNWPKGRIEMTSPPAIYKDLVITGSQLQEFPSKGPSGAIRAFDVRTGKLVWRFDTVPGPGQTGHDTWDGDSWKRHPGPMSCRS